MKAAFFFDTVLLKDENNDFYGMTLTYDFFKERYLNMFSQMVVSTRVKKIDNEKGNVDGYRITNGENVEVKPITSYKDIPDAIKNYKKIENEVENVLKDVDKAIIRMPSVIGMFACKISKKLKKDYIIEMVACPWDGYMNHARLGGKVVAPIITILTKHFIKTAPKVLYVTDKFLQKRYPTNGKKIACSDVILENFNDDLLNKRIENIKKINENTVIKLGTAANVGLKYKGQKYVIEALKELNKNGIRYEYYLAGGGDNSTLLELVKEYKLENCVHFLGSLPHEKVFELLDTIDIYVQPSLQEGLPRAMIEAMSRACPCIGTNAGGIPELIQAEYVFKKRNYKQFIEILKKIDTTKLIDMAETNYKHAKEFEKDKLNKKRIEFYV